MSNVSTSDWQALSLLNDKLTKMENNQLMRVGFDPKLPEFLPLWVHANGGQLISDDGKTAMLDDPKVVEALDYAAGLQKAASGYKSLMAFRDIWDFFGGNNQFSANQLGAFPMGQRYINVLADSSDLPAKHGAVHTAARVKGHPGSIWTGR